jgi:hypothetical protein
MGFAAISDDITLGEAQAAGSDEVQGGLGQQPPRRRLRRREVPSGDGGADDGLGGVRAQHGLSRTRCN